MADRSFKLEVITPDRIVLSEKHVISVIVPGVEGYFGVLYDHAPLMTQLTIGEIDFRRADKTEDFMAISGGFMEVFNNKVTVLAETAEMSEEIDIARAEEAVHRAEETLAKHDPNVDLEKARISLLKALNRLNVARHARRY